MINLAYTVLVGGLLYIHNAKNRAIGLLSIISSILFTALLLISLVNVEFVSSELFERIIELSSLVVFVGYVIIMLIVIISRRIRGKLALTKSK